MKASRAIFCGAIIASTAMLASCASTPGVKCQLNKAMMSTGGACGSDAKLPPAPEPEPVAEPTPEPPKMMRAVLSKNRIELKEKVQFETGSADLSSASNALLDEVVKIMTDHAEIKKIRIEGHTDSVGSKKFNMKLSKNRAASVMTYLADAGIDGARMESDGFGPNQPIADNGTDEGRESNRRVEIKILERDE